MMQIISASKHAVPNDSAIRTRSNNSSNNRIAMRPCNSSENLSHGARVRWLKLKLKPRSRAMCHQTTTMTRRCDLQTKTMMGQTKLQLRSQQWRNVAKLEAAKMRTIYAHRILRLPIHILLVVSARATTPAASLHFLVALCAPTMSSTATTTPMMTPHL